MKNNEEYTMLLEFLSNIVDRLPQNIKEKHARRVHSSVSSPRSPGQLFNFASMLNPNMPREMFDDVVTGILANLQQMMTSSRFRMQTDNIKMAPPISSPVPNLTFTAGDIDTLLDDDDDKHEVNNDESNMAKQTIKNLKESREAKRNMIKDNPKVKQFIHNLGSASVLALQKAYLNDAGFIESLTSILADKGLTSSKFIVNPVNDYYLSKTANTNKTGKSITTGAIPLVVAAKLGKAVVDFGPLLVMAYKMITGASTNSSIQSDTKTSISMALGDKSLSTLSANAEASGFKEVATVLAKADNAIKSIASSFSNQNVSTPNAIAWREIYGKQFSNYIIKNITFQLQLALSQSYAKINPEQKQLIALLTPKNNVPFYNLMQSTWDPIAIQDENVAWADFLDYTTVALKLNKDLQTMMGKTKVSDLRSQFLYGASKVANAAIPNIMDGWDNVSKSYLKLKYPLVINQFVNGLTDNIKKAYSFSSLMSSTFSLVTPNLMYPSGNYSAFFPWRDDFMVKFKLQATSIQKTQSSKPKVSNISNVSSINPGVNNVVLNNDVVPGNNGVNVVSNDNVINQPNTNNQTQKGADADGTILITPYETVVSVGHYVDPQTGQVNDYSDLYRLGRSVREMRDKAMLFIDLPGSRPLGSGDPLIGGLFSIAGKIGKKLAQTKLGKKVVDKVKDKVLSKIPIVKQFVKSQPQEAQKIAQTSNMRETQAVSKLENMSSLPPSSFDPTSMLEGIKAIKESSEVLRGIDQKTDQIIDALSQLKINTISIADQITTGLAPKMLESNSSIDENHPYSAVDVIEQATDDGMSSSDGEMSDGSNGYAGDIDIWKILP